ncbi:MAG: VOC family protein [Solirubrobacterales bacterium]|nr:VOC family protein [Solirubrobacterales bacterium]
MMMRLDFIGIPSRDADRARSFYRDAPGLRPDEHARYEQWAGDACFGIWEPEKVGMPFVAQKGNPWALGCDDVRPHWQSKGYE